MNICSGFNKDGRIKLTCNLLKHRDPPVTCMCGAAPLIDHLQRNCANVGNISESVHVGVSFKP